MSSQKKTDDRPTCKLSSILIKICFKTDSNNHSTIWLENVLSCQTVLWRMKEKVSLSLNIKGGTTKTANWT